MKNLIKFTLLLSITLCTSANIFAQTKLSVQGVIRLSDGNAIEDGLYPITFKLYDAETGGMELWSETQPTLKVTSGIYSTILGEVTPLDLPFDEFYFLSLTVEGEELLPRAPLTSAPYSNSVLGFDNVFTSSGPVGIGTLSPNNSLQVIGTGVFDSIGVGTSTPNKVFQVNGDSHLNGATSISNSLAVNSSVLFADGNNVGVGTSSPNNAYKLDINGTSRAGSFFIDSQSSAPAFDYTTSCLTNGKVLYYANIWACPSPNFDFIHMYRGTSTMFQVDAWGNVFYDGDITDISDKRVKENIKPITNAIEKIKLISGYSYNKIGEELSNREYGVIAQDVQNIFPEMVSIFDEEKGYLGVSYIQLIPVLIEAAKELSNEVNDLKNKNEELKNLLTSQTRVTNEKLAQLESKLNQLLTAQSVSKL